jgi:hypothetical protein
MAAGVFSWIVFSYGMVMLGLGFSFKRDLQLYPVLPGKVIAWGLFSDVRG